MRMPSEQELKRAKVDEPVQAKEELEKVLDNQHPKYRLKHVVRENASTSILDVAMLRLKMGPEAGAVRDLFATIQTNQANVYEGKYLDLASHFWNATTKHVPKVADISACCWVKVEEDENEAILVIGSADGLVQVISLSESRVKLRLGENESGDKVIDVCSSRRETYTCAALIEEASGATRVDIWNVLTGSKKRTFAVAPNGEFRRLQYVPSRETVAISTETELVFFDQGKESARVALPAQTTDVRFVNRNLVFLLYIDGACALFDVDVKSAKTIIAKTCSITCIAVSLCGRYLAAGNAVGEAFIFDMDTGELDTFSCSKTKAFFTTACAFGARAPESLVCVSADGAVWQWVLR